MDLVVKVEQIFVKVQNLLLLQSDLKVHNERLSADNERLKKIVEDKNIRIRELEDKNKVLRLAKSLGADEPAKHELKLKLNEIIREVDKNIAMLNT